MSLKEVVFHIPSKWKILEVNNEFVNHENEFGQIDAVVDDTFIARYSVWIA